jgi:hypothetical protein
VSLSEVFDTIAARARRDSAEAVATYREQQGAIAERLRVRAESAVHRRGVTRDSVAARGAILLPAGDIDLSPHTPVPASEPIAGGQSDPGATTEPEPDGTGATDFSYRAGWLSDR